MKLSVVTTLFRSANYVQAFLERATRAAEACTDDFEIVLVNDGSPDDSLQRALESGNPRLVVVDLSRNFGHHRAMMAGLAHASGQLVFLIDVDLEEPPENLPRFWRHMSEHPAVDVVVGETSSKPGGTVRRFASSLFYRVFNALSPVKIPEMAMVSRLMRRPYVDALLQYRESEPFLPALWIDAGFRQEHLQAQKIFDGNSTYTIGRRLRMALHAISSFSSMPLIYLFWLGASFSVGAILFALFLIIQRLYRPDSMLPGWSSVIAAMFFIGGVIIFSLGVLGLYLAKIYREVKGRPNVLVRTVFRVNGAVER